MTIVTPLQQNILKLHRAGKSRGYIANILGITEWNVRTTIRSFLTRELQVPELKQKTPGFLRLANVKKRKASSFHKAFVLNDIHIPYHDQKALAVALAYMKDTGCNDICLNGDIIDFYNVSSYNKDPARLITLQDELNETKSFLAHLRKTFPKASITYTLGNHDTRLQRHLISKSPELSTLDSLSLDELFDIQKYDIKMVDESHSVIFGDLEVIHGYKVRKDSGASAKSHHMDLGGSVLIGHVHRLGVYYNTNRYGTHICIENGHLGRTDFDYVNRPNWQQGFCEIDYCQDGRFFFRQHAINNGSLVVGDIKYEAE